MTFWYMSRLYDLWFFPIFSFKQTLGGSYHRSYKLDKERVSLSPNLQQETFFNSVVDGENKTHHKNVGVQLKSGAIMR